MKRILFIAILLILGSIALQSCYSTATNEKNTVEWVRKAKKPIICNKQPQDLYVQKRYTLIDANLNVYQTGLTNLTLPDTIK